MSAALARRYKRATPARRGSRLEPPQALAGPAGAVGQAGLGDRRASRAVERGLARRFMRAEPWLGANKVGQAGLGAPAAERARWGLGWRFTSVRAGREREWDRPGSNRRLRDLQSRTLPTELLSHKVVESDPATGAGRRGQSGGLF